MPDKKIKIFFHIGQAKTGTSAIQSFLNVNRELLSKKYHVLYPNTNSPDFVTGNMHNHAKFFEMVPRGEKKECIDKVEECLNYCSGHGIETIVFSVESLEWFWFPPIIHLITDTYQVDYAIILYLRRQDYYLEAAWKQWGHKNPRFATLNEYAAVTDLDLYQRIIPWLKIIDKEKFIVRRYEKSTIGDDVVKDFLNIIGISPDPEFKESDDNNLNKNNGLNRDVMEILTLCKRMVKDDHNNDLLDLMYNTLSEYYRKQPMAMYNYLSPNERLNIIEQYKTSNNKLAEIFFGPGEVLFTDPLPEINDSWEPYQGLTLEKTVPIFMEILYRQNNQIRALRQVLNETKNIIPISIYNVFHNSSFNNQIRNLQLINECIHFSSSGDDPIIILQKFDLPPIQLIFKIDITVPVNTFIQLYFKTSYFKNYSEEYSVKMPVKKGRQVVELKIPVFKINGRLRLDPGSQPGEYAIHKIDFSI